MTTPPAFYRSGAMEHQLRDYERFKDSPYFALFWEQRTRKTGTTYAIWRHHIRRGHLDALVVIGWPSGVKWVWAEEAQYELPPESLSKTKILVWESKYTQGNKKQEAMMLREHHGPIILSMNCEALNSERTWEYLNWLLQTRRAMVVADEASWAVKYRSGRTQRLLALGGWKLRTAQTTLEARRNVIVKAILDGTPIEENPTEIYYPTEFLKKHLLGFETRSEFLHYYSEYKLEEITDIAGVTHQVHAGKKFKGIDANGEPMYDRFPILTGYRNIPDLRKKIFTFGTRVLRSDVSDAPPKQYSSHYFELTTKQRREYERARDEFLIQLERGMVPIGARLKVLIRLQMIARNYYPPEKIGVPCAICGGLSCFDDGTACEACEGLGVTIQTTQLERIDNTSPALDALIEVVNQIKPPLVVWALHRQDCTDSAQALVRAGFTVLTYTGELQQREAEHNYNEFRSGNADIIVGTIGGGLQRGKDLSRGIAAIYYSNSFSGRARRQTEDRTEGLLRTFSTSVVDLLAAGTRDVRAVEALRAKRHLSQLVMGDPQTWL